MVDLPSQRVVPLGDIMQSISQQQLAFLSSISMPKLACFCEFAQCGGTIVDSKTFDRHKRHDSSNRVRDAIAKATTACKSQDDVIAAHLASLSLTSNSKSPLQSIAVNASPRLSGKSTEQKLVEKSLYQLRDIEMLLEDLAVSVDGKLCGIGNPGAANDAFPLLCSISTTRTIRKQLSGITSRAAPVQEAKSSLLVRLGEVVAKLEAAKHTWNTQAKGLPIRGDSTSETIFGTEQHNVPILQHADPIIQVTLFTMVVMQVMLHTSRRGCHFLLSMLRYIVQLCLMREGRVLNVYDQKLLSDFPKDPSTAVKQFKLEAKEVIYAVCPKQQCQVLYRPVYQKGSPIAHYPIFCTHKSFDDSECGTRITRPRGFGKVDVEVPIKRFVSFSFKDYIAELTSRSGYEDMMDGVWKGERERDTEGVPEEMHDVFDGQFLRDFKDRDGHRFGRQTKEGRYVFSLSVDFFNPFTNKQAGKCVSFGVISVVCLNLPPSMRYKTENMFLAGVIPGPKEPPLTLKQYLSPLVDEFLVLWYPGVQFSRTCNFPDGRLILCALILVICDLLAARKTAGYAACSHEHFCNMCKCTRTGQGYGNTDCGTWGQRSNEEWRKAATEYQACRTEEYKTAKFTETGVRWSELLRLPYFDISRCIVVDPMHNLFLGLIKEHFTGILGINISKHKQDEPAIVVNLATIPSKLNPNDVKGVEKLRRWLEKPASTFLDRDSALKKLQRVNLPALEFVCVELHLLLPLLIEPRRSRHTKAELANALLDWRLQQPEIQNVGSSTSTVCGHVLLEKEIEEIRLDIDQLLTPTWMTSVPSQIGSSSHGKLKADQWRALGTTHLLLSLIRLWGFKSDGSPRSDRCVEILDVTISLISAIIIATSHTVTSASASAYKKHMLDYINGVKRLFPDYHIHPNHHMSLHIPEFLLLFGPVHSWWSFPFERLIGNIQKMPNNGKIGDMEETIALAYTRTANLRALLLKSGCPEVIHHSKVFFDKLLNPQVRDSLVTDIHMHSAAEETSGIDNFEDFHEHAARPIPAEIRDALHSADLNVPSRAVLQTHITIHGLKFAIASNHPGNSCIMISSEGGSPQPAQLVYILEFDTPETPSTYLAVRRYEPATIACDPFLKYPVLRAKLWNTRLADVEIIRISQVLSHFACLPIRLGSHSFNAVISLSRTYIPDHDLSMTKALNELTARFEELGLN